MSEKTLKDFTKKEIAAAHKELKATNTNYMALTMGYQHYLLPYIDGMLIMKAFESAVAVKSNYGNDAYVIMDDVIEFGNKLVPNAVALEAKTLHLLLPPKKE